MTTTRKIGSFGALVAFAVVSVALSGCSDTEETSTTPATPESAVTRSLSNENKYVLQGFVPAESRWLAHRRNGAHLALKDLGVQLLISPVQGEVHNFDPIERSLITRLVSDRISRGSDLVIANPDLVSQFYGLHQLTIPSADHLKLARATLADEVLTMHAVHDQAGRFDITATVISMPSLETLRERTWTDLKFSDSAPPSVAIGSVLDELAEFAAGQSLSPDPQPELIDFEADDFRFSGTLGEIAEESANSPIRSAVYLQMLGMLHASGAFNEARDRLFERSLVSLRHVSADTPYRDYLAARAYAYLHRRPAAIAALGNPKTRHDRALLALLNGNLPQLQSEFEQMGTSVLDFMTFRDLLYLEQSYGREEEHQIAEKFIEESLGWATFVYRAIIDTSKWANFSSSTIKLGLEELLPAEVPSVESAIEKAIVIGETPAELDFTRMVFQHIEAIENEQTGGRTELAENHIDVSSVDVLELARATAIANLVRRNQDDLQIRKSPEPVIRRIVEFDAFFSGHPEITLQLARAKLDLSEEKEGLEKSNLSDEAYEYFRNGFSWTAQLTKEAVNVAEYRGRYFGGYNGTVYIDREDAGEPQMLPLRYTEWPKSMAWFRTIWPHEADDGAFDSCIDYTWVQFGCVTGKIKHGEKDQSWTAADREAVFSSVAHRFDGSPKRTDLVVQMAREGDDGDTEIAELRNLIAAGHTDRQVFYALGRALKRRGGYREAQEAWLSYPGFSNAGGGIDLSEDSYANNAGSQLFWVGQHELATPLLQLSANSGTGSESQMSSSARLGLISGDLAAAEYWSAERVRRYGSKYGIRDLQQILHISGQPDLAWGLFEQARAIGENSEVWSGPLVGHRIQAETIDDLLAWIKESGSRESAEIQDPKLGMGVNLATRYLLLAGTMDRAPGPELEEAIRQVRIAKPTTYGIGGAIKQRGRQVYRDYGLTESMKLSLEMEHGAPFPSRHELLAKAMQGFLRGDHETAFEWFDATAHHYRLEEYLPYLVFSASVLGRADHFLDALAERESVFREIREKEGLESSEFGYRFDEDLAYGVLAAFDGRHVDVLDHFQAALNNRPYVEDRTIYPYYEVVELAELLFRQTGKPEYRDFALELARRHTVVLPMYSWAYFVVATHSGSKVERVKALASGLYLDPLSHRATLLPPELIEKAREVLDDSGPPYLRRTAVDEQTGA